MRSDPLFWLALGLALVILAMVASRWARQKSRSRVARRRGARAVRGERQAERLLSAHGYDVIETQATRTWQLETSTGWLAIELRADLIVEQDGRRMVAEVKTGDLAPSLSNAATRRQLLEYSVAYPVDGVLLVDVENERIIEVEFPRGTAE